MALIAQLLPWVLPPLLGAIIGYVTNAIAIRMLFRPFNEIRVVGIRLPFTPGIIPRQRGDLAESMARMVSTELLTETALRNQIRSPFFRTAMERNVGSLTSELLGMRLADAGTSLFGELVPGEGRVESFGTLLAAAFSGFSHSSSFKLLMRAVVTHFVDKFAERPLESLSESDGRSGRLLDRILAEVTSDRSRAEFRKGVSGWVERELEANEKLARYLKAEDGEALALFLDRIYPSLAALIVRWLRSEGMQRELAVRGRFLVQDIVDRLTGLQRLIISAAQYQRTLDQNMGKIVGDALDAIEEALVDPENRQRVVETMRRELDAARERGVGDLAGEHRNAVTGAVASLADRLIGALAEPRVREGIGGFFLGGDGSPTVGSLFSRLFDLRGGSPGQFIADLLFPVDAAGGSREEQPWGGLGQASARRPAGDEDTTRPPSDKSAAAAALSHEKREMRVTGDEAAAEGSRGLEGEISATIAGFFRSFLAEHGEMAVGEFLGMDERTKERFDQALAGTLITTVDARAAEILASIDVRELVVSKINGLDIEEVEGLLLQVIQKHLQYINIFGGILGGLIGLIQDLARILHLSS